MSVMITASFHLWTAQPGTVPDEDGRALVAPALLAGFDVVAAERAVDEPPSEVVAEAAV